MINIMRISAQTVGVTSNRNGYVGTRQVVS